MAKLSKALREAIDADAKQTGPTLRDQFAMAALTGYLSNNHCWDVPDDRVASWAYSQADAMLAAREAK